jgi:hypothetical protein
MKSPLHHLTPLYVSRPRLHWAVCGALAALVSTYLLANAAHIVRQPLSDTWLALLVCAQLTAIALWLCSRPSISVAVDNAAGELEVTRGGMFGTTEMKRVSITDVLGVARGDIETTEGCVYQAELQCRDGARLPVTSRLTCQHKCEAIVSQLQLALHAHTRPRACV